VTLSLIMVLRYNGSMEQSGAMIDSFATTDDMRQRIILAAAELIANGGRDVATTRAVAAAANVQAPTIYRLFGDKSGLLDAVAEYGLAAYVAGKTILEPHPDPVEALRNGWDMHVEFGLAHPGLFAIMNGDPRPRPLLPVLAAGFEVLQRRIKNIALAGRLKVSEERALAIFRSSCNGTILTLLSQSKEQRDAGLSEAAREAAIAAVTGEVTVGVDQGPSSFAVALRASLDQISVLTQGEKHLLQELLDRIASRQ
jgi:AcrR family transcriptional regulator